VDKAAKTKSNSTALALPSIRADNKASSPFADNKIFLFLYFIVPIFFATFKNSTSPSLWLRSRRSRRISEAGKAVLSTVIRSRKHALTKYKSKSKSKYISKSMSKSMSKLVMKRTQNKIKNQIKQLRSLIKLMLNSSALRSQWILRPSGLQQNNPYPSNLKYPTVLKQTTLANSNIVDNFTSLFKWSVLLIAQSLVPLKRKHEYYSLIFINILKSRKILPLRIKK